MKMGFTRLAMASMLLLSFLLLLHQSLATQTDHDHQPGGEAVTEKADDTPKIDCGAACKARCQLSSRPRLCNRACGTCCSRCNCVPPGTSGNYDACPCYASLTTHGNRRKCP